MQHGVRTLLRDVSIGRRLTAAFGLVCLLLVVVAGTGVYASMAQEHKREDIQRLQHLRDEVQQLRYLDADISGWQGYIYAGSAA